MVLNFNISNVDYFSKMYMIKISKVYAHWDKDNTESKSSIFYTATALKRRNALAFDFTFSTQWNFFCRPRHIKCYALVSILSLKWLIGKMLLNFCTSWFALCIFAKFNPIGQGISDQTSFKLVNLKKSHSCYCFYEPCILTRCCFI